MTDPFLIEGPAVVSFSGGRTSGLMLRRILDAGLQPDVHVLFANTGKEREETLRFVHECETRWNVPIHWLEYRDDRTIMDPGERGPGFAEVDFATASRNGEPFDAIILRRNFLPNPVTRFCTEELKVRVMKKWMLSRGYEEWTNQVGMRADEPHRVARLAERNATGKERWDAFAPLAAAGISERDVMEFWKSQPFDLQLRQWEGNCDLCFLKSSGKKLRIIQDRPDLADWWIAKEAQAIGRDHPDQAFFRRDQASYAELRKKAHAQGRLFRNDDDDEGGAMPCACTDRSRAWGGLDGESRR